MQSDRRGRPKGLKNKIKPEIRRMLGEATLHYAHARFKDVKVSSSWLRKLTQEIQLYGNSFVPSLCVQPNVNPVLQSNHESEGVQLNVNPSLQPNHESRGVQPNINPSLQPNHKSGGVQPDVNPSLQQNNDSMPTAGSSEEQQFSQPKNAGDELCK
ncbi:hypothetical protein Q3G72_002970 [Acer saccharum]|nr:hypothetical protein Q3G72_002970 [Acer saccharum]